MTKFSTLAHRDHVFCSPISPEKADRVLALLDLPPGARVLDVGCGKGELLLRCAAYYDAQGVGVDINSEFLRVARDSAERRVLGGRLTFHEVDAERYPAPPESFDAALCVGSSHAYGTPRDALAALAGLVGPGRHILLGETYWRRPPAAEYLDALGATEADYTDHRGNVARGEGVGLVPLYSCVSSEDEWDHYEGLYSRAVERYAARHPDDPDVPEFLERIRRWRDAYLRHGRRTLGFGLYLFQKPPGAGPAVVSPVTAGPEPGDREHQS